MAQSPKPKLDQFYTRPEVAELLYDVFKEHFDPDDYQMVEPSAGDGAFFRLLPPCALGYDLEPKCPGIARADFLSVRLPTGRSIAVIGNPPFGVNASTAVRFFNYAASQAEIVAMIVPRSFRKAAIENCLHRHFHLLREVEVPQNAFLSHGRQFHVSTVFQIWVRGTSERPLRDVRTTHPDFEFTTRRRANFVVQRVGARAGRVHRNFKASPNSHYFIRGMCGSIMARLDFATAAANATANPSLAKSEIVSLYRNWMKGRAIVGVTNRVPKAAVGPGATMPRHRPRKGKRTSGVSRRGAGNASVRKNGSDAGLPASKIVGIVPKTKRNGA